MQFKKAVFLVILLVSSFGAMAQQFRALLFTKTAGWHHESIHTGVNALRWLAKRNNFELEWNENADLFFYDQTLEEFDVIIFLNTTMDILNDDQQKVFEKFIQSGKGFVGIHSASDTEYNWPWYNQLVGRMFYIHPETQTALLRVMDANFPGMQLMPESRWWTDEWYTFGEEKIDNLNYLLTVDESSYSPAADWDDKKSDGMGDFHPIAWYHEFDGGRAFYTGLGHVPETFEDTIFLEHIYGGIFWAATGKGVLANGDKVQIQKKKK